MGDDGSALPMEELEVTLTEMPPGIVGATVTLPDGQVIRVGVSDKARA